MLFMVIETFPAGAVLPIYRHLNTQGRGLPDGVEYIDSWITADFRRCFQLMRTDNVALLQRWVLHWEGLGVAWRSCRSRPARTPAPPSRHCSTRTPRMLELRPNCECCGRDLPPDSTQAMICTFECTWCRDCAATRLPNGVCPNCQGNLVPRPIRPAAMLARHPPTGKRLVRPERCVAVVA